MREELVGFLNDARDKLTKEVDIDHGLLNKLLKKKVLNDAHVECIKVSKYVLLNFNFQGEEGSDPFKM